MTTQEALDYVRRVDAAERRMHQAAGELAVYARLFLANSAGIQRADLEAAVRLHTEARDAYYAAADDQPLTNGGSLTD